MSQNLGSSSPLSHNVTLHRPPASPLTCDVIYGCPLQQRPFTPIRSSSVLFLVGRCLILIRLWNDLNMTIQSWKNKSFDYLAKTTLALGAYSQFQNLKGSVLHFSNALRENEWITERGTSSAIFFGLVYSTFGRSMDSTLISGLDRNSRYKSISPECLALLGRHWSHCPIEDTKESCFPSSGNGAGTPISYTK